MVKNLPASAGDVRDVGSIPGLGRSLENRMAMDSSVLAWKILWIEAEHRVLIKRGPGNRGPTECGTTHEATSGMSS